MNFFKHCKLTLGQLVLALVTVGIMAAPSFAATVSVDLAAVEAEWLPPGGTSGTDEIPMWAFVETDTCPTSPVTWDVGPKIVLLPTDSTLQINLLNCLPAGSEPVSIVIPGQAMATPGTGSGPVFWSGGAFDGRVRSFTQEAPAGGGVQTYTWSSVNPGTYLYHSGTHPQVQVQMGLYGAVTKDYAAAPARAYDNIPYDQEVKLLFSEIDPALHAAVDDGSYGTTGPTSTRDYQPKYFLINGEPYSSSSSCIDPSTWVGQRILLRMINAGLREFGPMILGGRWDLVAEGGNKYPFAKDQYSVLLPPISTKDVIFTPGHDGKYPIIERRLNLTNATETDGGMQTCIQVGPPPGPLPVAIDDGPYVVDEGGTLNVVAASGVLTNDTLNGGTLNTNPTSGPFYGTPSFVLNADGSFTYEHNGSESTSDAFVYRLTNINGSAQASASITVNPVNDAPVVTNPGPQAGTEGDSVSLQIVAIDVDSINLSYNATNLPPSLSIAPTTGLITGNLATSSSTGSPYSVDVTVTENDGLPPNLFDTVSFAWTVAAPETQSPLISAVNAVPNPTVDATSVTLTATVDDSTTGGSNIQAAEYFIDGVDLGAGLNTAMSPSDTIFNSPTEGVTASVDVSGLSAGSHTLHVRGQDSANNWSAVVDTTLEVTDPDIYMSFTNNTVVPGVGTVTDDDIVGYYLAADTWSLVFDGSDVGIDELDINAMHMLNDGTILMSFEQADTVPGVGPVDDSDIVQFTPTSLGPNTAGSFSMYFDGSDVGLASGGENIDGLHVLSNGNLLISTTAFFSVGAVVGVDEDVFRFIPTSLGATTSGSWAMRFDGSDVGLGGVAGEDIDAISFTPPGTLYFSTLGDYVAPGASGANEDISSFTGTFGPTTSGTILLELDLSTIGIGTGENVDAISGSVP